MSPKVRLPLASGAPAPEGAEFEIQLSHLCNNRCVFCVSGRNTHDGRAPIVPLADLVARLAAARAKGHRRVTILGGEPTILPHFVDVVREAAALGFDEIVIFSNGARLRRRELLDAVFATGARLEFRFSFQGATKESHERTTRRRGSFDQLLASVDAVRARGGKVTANMCLVASNHEDVHRFAELLLPRGIEQLHVDMMNPYDTGISELAELHAVQARYRDMAPSLRAMVEAFPEGFDVHVGNLPFCVEPRLAGHIHHAGQATETATLSGDGLATKDKYDDKTRRRVKTAACRSCVFEPDCTGFFGAYLEQHGDDELRPVTEAALLAVDPGRRWFAFHVRRRIAEALGVAGLRGELRRTRAHELDVLLPGGVELEVRRPGAAGCHASTDVVSLGLRAGGEPGLRALSRLFEALVRRGERAVHAPGPDAIRAARPSVERRLGRLRGGAPLAAVSWTETRAVGDQVEVTLLAPDGGRAVLWLAEERGRPRGGYRVEGQATPGLVAGLRDAMAALGR